METVPNPESSKTRPGPGGVELSLVVASRHDRHQGNSVGRLATAINFLGASLAAVGRVGQVELVICDWGSPTPLREVLDLTAQGRAVVRFLEVPPELAKTKQHDSVFPEVLALNAAVRRCGGEFIGRIDQDTLVTEDFLRTFFERHLDRNENRDGPGGFAFLRRRSLPYAVCRRDPSTTFFHRLVARLGNWLPVDAPHASPWFDAPVGVVLMKRDLWFEMRAYDERLLYWGWMETDLGFRVQQRGYPTIDLHTQGFAPLYHIEHVPLRLPSVPRRQNQRVIPARTVPKNTNWGLVNEDLPLRRVDGARPGLRTATNDSRWLWSLAVLSLPSIWMMNVILHGYKLIRTLAGMPRYPTASLDPDDGFSNGS